MLGEEGRSWSGREPDVFFDNRGGSFEEVGSLLGLHSTLDGRGAAAADLDGDGDLDLVVLSRNSPGVRIYRNDVVSQGDLVRIDLGPAADSGRALGAEIEVRCGDRSFLRLVSAGSGFLSQAPAASTFGLGACPALDEVRVRRGAEVLSIPGPFLANRAYRVVDRQMVDLGSFRSRVVGEASSGAAAGKLVSFPLPTFRLQPLAGRPVPPLKGEGTLVLNFWATWCTACAREHAALLAVAAEPSFSDVSFVAVSLDEPTSGEPDRDAVAGWGAQWLHGRTDPAGQAAFGAGASLPPGAVPLTAVVHDGVVRWLHPGAVSATALRAAIDRVRD